MKVVDGLTVDDAVNVMQVADTNLQGHAMYLVSNEHMLTCQYQLCLHVVTQCGRAWLRRLMQMAWLVSLSVHKRMLNAIVRDSVEMDFWLLLSQLVVEGMASPVTDPVWSCKLCLLL